MKIKYLSVIFSFIMISSGSACAAEIYIKDRNKLDLFGNIGVLHYFSGDENKNGDRYFINYGFKGETKIKEGIIGFSTWEQAQSFVQRLSEREDISNNFTRRAFAGIKLSDIGSITYGRNYGILYDIGSWTNVMPEFGGDNTLSDNFMTGPANSVLTYRNKNFFGKIDGLNFAMQYQGKNDNKKYEKLHMANGEGYGLSAIYDVGNGFYAGAAYTNSNRTLAQRLLNSENNNKKAIAYSIGLKYDANSLYLSSLYSEARHMTPYGDFLTKASDGKKYGFADKARNIELVAQYAFDFGLRPSIGYLQSRIDGIYQDKTKKMRKYIEVGANYNINKNVLSFIDYRINIISKNDLISNYNSSKNNILAIGMKYMF